MIKDDRLRYKERFRAGGIHFLFSFIVVLLFLVTAEFLFYPGALSKLGLYDGFLILVLVDIILGPLLTTVVYDSRKKSLRFDLGVIVLFQLCALVYGMSLVYSQKPCVMVLSHEGLVVYTMADCREYKIQNQFKSHIGPVSMVTMDLPQKIEEINVIQFATELVEGKPLAARSDLYVRVQDLSEDQLSFYLSGREYLDAEKCHVLPLISEHLDGSVCVDLRAARLKWIMQPHLTSKRTTQLFKDLVRRLVV